MAKSNSHKNITSHSEAPTNAADSQKKCEVINVKAEHKWTANVSFVPYPSEQKDRAYRNWVKLFLKSLRDTTKHS